MTPPGCPRIDFSSSLKDRTHQVGIITTAPELYHGLRNERSRISHLSGRLGQRSRGAHRQRPGLVQSCQQSRRVVLFPYPITLHRASNIDGRGCVLPGTSLNSGASFEWAGGPSPPKEKEKRKKERKKRKNGKKKERKKGTMNNVKLLNIKCCFFLIFQ